MCLSGASVHDGASGCEARAGGHKGGIEWGRVRGVGGGKSCGYNKLMAYEEAYIKAHQ